MTEFRTLRGMRDILPEDAETMVHIENAARKVAGLYGYKEYITPVVESYELLAAKAGDEVRSRMFTFKDLGGRDVALRPEFTASIARIAASTLRNEPKPCRIFCIGTAYRYDEPQRGRYREFWQSDYELIGTSRPEADAEILMLTDSLMQEAGLRKFTIRVGHIGILREILSQEKISEKEQDTIMQLMDKEQYEDAVRAVEKSGTSQNCLKTLRALVECKGHEVTKVLSEVRAIVKDYEGSVEAVENLRQILELIVDSGCRMNLTVDAGFARGLEYYTGMIFEPSVPEMDIAVGGGGRYDKLVELFGGEPTPAVGVAHGIDRIMLAMQELKVHLKKDETRAIFVFPVKQELRAEALKISRALRDAGFQVEFEVMGRKMTKALEDADRRKMDYAVIVGERELKEDSVVIRDLAERQQKTVKIDEIVREMGGPVG